MAETATEGGQEGEEEGEEGGQQGQTYAHAVGGHAGAGEGLARVGGRRGVLLEGVGGRAHDHQRPLLQLRCKASRQRVNTALPVPPTCQGMEACKEKLHKNFTNGILRLL